MNPKRKKARDRLLSISTKSELVELIESLNITDEERDIAIMVLSRGWSYTRISLETGYSVRHIARKMEKVYTKL